MNASAFETRNRTLRPVYLAAGLAAMGVPIISGAALAASLFFPSFWAYAFYVMAAVFAANLANVGVFLGISRARIGPARFRDLLSIGAVFSGVSHAVVVVLGGMFVSLGG